MDHSHDIWDKLPKEERKANIRACVRDGMCNQNIQDVNANRIFQVYQRMKALNEIKAKMAVNPPKMKKN